MKKNLRYVLVALLGLCTMACNQAEEMEAEYAHAYFEAGKEALAVKNVSSAITNLEVANKFSGQGKFKEDVQFNLAYAYFYAGSYKKALIYLDSVPDSYDVFWLKALCYKYSNDQEKAIRSLEQAIKLSNNSKQILDLKNWIGLCYLELEKYSHAERAFKEILNEGEAQETRFWALVNLGYLYLQTREYSYAINTLTLAKEMKSTPLVGVNLAEAYFKNGQIAKARFLTNEVLAHPDLTLWVSDMAQVLKLELQGADGSYFRAKLDVPNKNAEITPVNAENSVRVAEVEVSSIRERYAAEREQRYLIALAALLLVVAMATGLYLYRWWKYGKALNEFRLDVQEHILDLEAEGLLDEEEANERMRE
ncbi:tetratricopeptide repeat protein [Roseivirga sp. BDSF3-8]|uniref:tetratricopeptide repeat protein n=1 Tax=Roseivirga sp. BDSF3-8 TaxID=3241598 RepID=UPI003531C47F